LTSKRNPNSARFGVNVHDSKHEAFKRKFRLNSLYGKFGQKEENVMPRTKANIPANENEAQRFVRLANQRVNSILTTLKQLGQLRGSNYKSTPEQRKKIDTVLVEAVQKAVKAMESGEASQEFKL